MFQLQFSMQFLCYNLTTNVGVRATGKRTEESLGRDETPRQISNELFLRKKGKRSNPMRSENSLPVCPPGNIVVQEVVCRQSERRGVFGLRNCLSTDQSEQRKHQRK